MKKIIYLLVFSMLPSMNAIGQTLDWLGQFSSDRGVFIEDMLLDEAGNIFIMGGFLDTADFDPGPDVLEISTLNFASYLTKLSPSGDLIWAKNLGFIGSRTMDIDGAGNIYIGCNLFETADFDPGPGVVEYTADGFNDPVLLKLAPNGDFVWAEHITGPGNNYIEGIAVQDDGTIHATGWFAETLDFDPGMGTTEFTSEGSGDIYFLKMTTDADFIWAKTIGGTGFDYSLDLIVDDVGQIYTIGEFSGTVDFDPGPGTANLTSQGDSDMFISKMDASGNHQWVNQIGSPTFQLPHSLLLDDNGFLYVGGDFQDSIDLNLGNGSTSLNAQGTQGVFVTKMMASSGDLVWAKSFGGTNVVFGPRMAVDVNGTVFITGSWSGTADFDPGAGVSSLSADSPQDFDIFISRLSSNGDYECAVGIGDDWTQLGLYIFTTVNGEIIVGGTFEGTVDFDPGPGVAELTNVGSNFGLSNIHSDSYFLQTSLDPCLVVGVAENNFAQDISFFPNPSYGPLNIELNQVFTQIDLTIRDVTGKLLIQQSFSNTDRLNLDLSQQPSGMYFIELKTNNKNALLKVIRQ